MRTVYSVKVDHGEIRRVNINAAPMDHAGYATVRAAGIGTYQIFQETYHHETYSQVHPRKTRKADYLWRLDALARAMEAGCDDVGIGALFGLYDWKFEVLGLVAHALHLQKHYNVGPHTVSFPRLRPAQGVNIDEKYLVGDRDFKRLVAILRLSVPYTGLILTAREPAALRREVLAFGISQIDAGSRIELGGYTEVGDAQVMEREQFQLGDIRSLDEVMQELMVDGYVPSFCTACYRLGRTGEHFMEFAIPGFIQNLCTPNALTTLMEYLIDYASDGDPRRRHAADRAGIATAAGGQAEGRSDRAVAEDPRDRGAGFVFLMPQTRYETDLLGPRDVPADVLWGIHTLRAIENFPLAGRPVHRGLVHAFGAVKLAAARTNHELGWADEAEVRRHSGRLRRDDRRPARRARGRRCLARRGGHFDQHERQRGAGQSGLATPRPAAGRTIAASTRTTTSTATSRPTTPIPRPSASRRSTACATCSGRWSALMEAFQQKEKEFADVVKIGRTELQDAVLMTLGHEMSAYAEAFSRDRWRIYKCEERLRVVNLGGTAIGTTLGAPRQYVFRVVEHLRQITGLGLARAENLVEATQNADVFIEVSGILRTLAGNLLKMRQRSAAALFRPARRAGRNPAAAPPGRLVDHARQGEPGDSRGRGPGGHGRDGPRPDDRAGGVGGQPGTEPVPAAGGRQPLDDARPA